MKFFYMIIALGFFASSVFAQDIQRVSFPEDIPISNSDDIKGLQWNRWTSNNFTVLSINDEQARYLNQNLESIKTWSLQRWGFQDFDFPKICKVVVVDNPDLYLKMFRINKSRVEIREESSIAFILANDAPSKIISIPISDICFNELASRYNENFNYASYRGMSLLNGSLFQIRSMIVKLKPKLDQNQPIYFSESLFAISKTEYDALPEHNRSLFDQSALVTILMIRKEFGEVKLHKFLKSSSENNAETAIKEVLGFEDLDRFDATLKRYMFDLSSDVLGGVTPDSYLQIKPKK